MRVVSTDEMRYAEKEADRQGLSYDTMMESAGKAVAQAVATEARSLLDRVLILVGPGNNGGDGLVAARYLSQWGYRVTVYLWRRPARNDDLNRARLRGLPVSLVSADEDAGGALLRRLLEQHDIWVDALLGTGVKGPLREPLPQLLGIARAVRAQRRRGARGTTGCSTRPWVVAVDTPSGMDCDTGAADAAVLPADVTVTFAFPKLGHYRLPGAGLVGDLRVVDIGLPDGLLGEGLSVIDAAWAASHLPPRPLDGHKGTFGTVLVVAGSRRYCGAPRLAALAAARVGAGLVTLAVPQCIYGIVAGSVMEPTFWPLPDDGEGFAATGADNLDGALASVNVILAGPGWGQSGEREAFLWGLLDRCAARSIPMVLDADALNLLCRQKGWWQRLPKETVLTPHPGEMARLTQCSVGEVQADRVAVAQSAATRWGCTVLLKGAYTVVADPESEALLLPFANPALASGGTGDVLAGALAGIWAQGAPRRAAAACGAYLHGLAGEMARRRIGDAGLLAGDLLDLLPVARAALIDAKSRRSAARQD